MPASNNPRRQRWLRATLIVAALLLVLGVAFVAAVSWWARPHLARALSAALGQPVSIDALSLNPLTGAVSLGPIAIGHDADVMGVARLTVTPALRTLLRDDVVIRRMELADVNGVLQLDENYQPVLRGALTGDPNDSAAMRHVTVNELIVHGGALTVRYPVGDKKRDARLAITRFRATNLDFGRRTGAALNMSGEFDGTLDAAPVHATTDINLSGDAPAIGFDFSIRSLHLSPEIVRLPPPVDSFTGVVDVHAKMVAGGAAEHRALQLEMRMADAQIAGKEGSTISAKAVIIPALRVNLDDQAIDVGAVTLEQPVLAVRFTPNGVIVPVVPAGDVKRPSWAVTTGQLRATDGILRLLHDDSATDFALKSLHWDGVQPKGNGAFQLEAGADEGSLSARGTLAVAPTRVAIDAHFDKVSLAPLSELVAALPLHLSRGVASGTLTVGYGDQLDRLAGHLEMHDVHTAPPSPDAPREVLAVSEATADFSLDKGPERFVDITSIKLSYPYVIVWRRAGSVFPYSALVDRSPGTASRGSLPVRIDDVLIEGGKVEFLDATLEPVFWSSLTDVAAHLTGFQHPEMTIDQFTVAGKQDELSPTTVTGSLTEQGLRARAELQDVLLETLNAYVSPVLGYRITAGRMTTTVSAAPAPPLLASTVDLVLRGVDVLQIGKDMIWEQSGVPLPIALGLISDLSGDIRLSLPIAVDTQFQSVSFGSVFWQALRQAILNALTSPLRLLGSLFGTRGAAHAFAIDPIPFAIGSGQLDRAGRDRVAEIHRILTVHQGLIAVLLPQLTEKDVLAVGVERAARLAEQRNAAVRDAFVGATTDPIAPQRVLLAPWKPETAAGATGKPGVYVELQESA